MSMYILQYFADIILDITTMLHSYIIIFSSLKQVNDWNFVKVKD